MLRINSMASFLIFCLLNLFEGRQLLIEARQSPTLTLDLSISPCISISFYLAYFDTVVKCIRIKT